jgi:hypothetical protein
VIAVSTAEIEYASFLSQSLYTSKTEDKETGKTSSSKTVTTYDAAMNVTKEEEYEDGKVTEIVTYSYK